ARAGRDLDPDRFSDVDVRDPRVPHPRSTRSGHRGRPKPAAFKSRLDGVGYLLRYPIEMIDLWTATDRLAKQAAVVGHYPSRHYDSSHCFRCADKKGPGRRWCLRPGPTSTSPGSHWGTRSP